MAGGYEDLSIRVLYGSYGGEGFVVEVFREVSLGMDDGEEKRVIDRAVAAKMEMVRFGQRRQKDWVSEKVDGRS